MSGLLWWWWWLIMQMVAPAPVPRKPVWITRYTTSLLRKCREVLVDHIDDCPRGCVQVNYAAIVKMLNVRVYFTFCGGYFSFAGFRGTSTFGRHLVNSLA